MNYREYIKIDELLALQEPMSEANKTDEVTFIIVHQITELLLKLLHMEFDSLESIASPEIARVVSCFSKANEILTSLIGQIRFCKYIPQNDFFLIREKVYPASAYESLQFKRLLSRVGCDEDNASSQLWNKISECLAIISNSEDRNLVLSELREFKRLLNEWRQEHINIAYLFLGEKCGAQSCGVSFLKRRSELEVFPNLVEK